MKENILGKRLYELRTEKNLTMREMGEKIGVGGSSWNKYEKGHSLPGAEILVRMSDYFNVSLDYLLGKSIFKNNENIFNNEGTSIANESFFNILKTTDIDKPFIFLNFMTEFEKTILDFNNDKVSDKEINHLFEVLNATNLLFNQLIKLKSNNNIANMVYPLEIYNKELLQIIDDLNKMFMTIAFNSYGNKNL